ncbi:MAG: AAA family ATPase [Chloroflexi bacterium]|nr:AAA family ATPase [Chloroflexota bacterium]
MIKTLEIRNFKSIKHLNLPARRINVLIGEPNTGKSNILEALGFYCYAVYYHQNPLRRFVRFERTSNLFYDELLENPVEIALDNYLLKLTFEGGGFGGDITGGSSPDPIARISGGHTDLAATSGTRQELPPVRLYKFEVRQKFETYSPGYLVPPDGNNLLSLMLSHKEIREMATRVFSRFGLRVVLKPQEQKIEVQKQLEDIIVAYPYSLTSDTIQRVVFYLAAVLSNRESILVLEEPESHAFPYYTRYLAETIGLDERKNQYFVSTHSPYFLMPLIEKTPRDDLGIFLTYVRDYQTRVKALTPDEIEEIMQIDVFSNLDRYLEQA